MLRRRIFTKKGIDYSGAVAGDILCTDLMYVARANFATSGKTAIGVITYNSGTFIEAINLTDVFKAFGGFGTDIPDLTNYTVESEALQDVDGTANTDAIISELGSSDTLAAGYCRSYSTVGTSAGDWDFWALGQLKRVIDNITVINQGLTECSGTLITTVGNIKNYTTSTEYSANSNWVYSSFFGVYSQINKNSQILRPIIKLTYG